MMMMMEGEEKNTSLIRFSLFLRWFARSLPPRAEVIVSSIA